MVSKGYGFLIAIQYIFLFLWVYWVAVSCAAVETFDLGRSYEEAKMYVEEYSMLDMILIRSLKTFDFLYYVILYLAVKASIPLNLVTTTIVFLYYVLIINSVRKIFGAHVGNAVMLIALFTTPMIWIVSVARNLTAFVFLFIAIFFYYKKRYILACVFAIFAVLTHLTVLMYIGALAVCIILSKKEVSGLGVSVILTFVLLISFFAPSILQDSLLKYISSQDLSYNTYSDMAATFYLLNPACNYSDKVPITFGFIYSVVLLYQTKKKGFEFWGLLALTSMLLLFMNSAYHLVMRCLMMMPIFWGLNVGRIYYSGTPKSKSIVFLTSVIGLFSIILHLYGNRHIYFAFI